MAKTESYDTQKSREAMVRYQLEQRGIKDKRTLDAMRKVPRHEFVPESERFCAYDDRPLPIGEGQTISQPLMVAMMTEALKLRGGEKVLEIGTGSGYAAAVLAEIAGTVITIERIRSLADRARRDLERTGYGRVRVICGDGTKGWAEDAPYDGIVVTAGGPTVPASLKEQLKVGGRIVIPVGDFPRYQSLVRMTRTGEDDYEAEDLGGVLFVPLIGDEGWSEDHELPRFMRIDEDAPNGAETGNV